MRSTSTKLAAALASLIALTLFTTLAFAGGQVIGVSLIEMAVGGTAANPSYSFGTNNDGMYQSANNYVEFGAGGSRQMYITSGSISAESNQLVSWYLDDDAKASGGTVTPKGQVFNNDGASGTATFTLQASNGNAGRHAWFVRTASYALRIDPQAGDKFVVIGAGYTDGEYMELATDGAAVHLFSNGDNWFVLEHHGAFGTDMTEETP